MNKELLKGVIDILVLTILLEKDSYGYEISKKISAKSEDQFEILEATLYVALKRLEKYKYIESYWGEQSKGGKRKYYRISEGGTIYLFELKQEYKVLSSVVQKFL
ncbi:PadR family transcriptional regulator [Staphylococcus pseudoxylosus]|uniref:PadR family transcriptional regulator n=1 Tax=Staphylococcus pseudoxylosus TaxID=2282419 RepID=UPI003905EFE1